MIQRSTRATRPSKEMRKLRQMVRKAKKLEMISKRDEDTVKVTGVLIHETRHALLLKVNGQNYWIPRAEITGKAGGVVCAVWMSKENKERFIDRPQKLGYAESTA